MKFAMVFPGQGSQAVGMLDEFAANHELIKDTFGEAGEVLQYNLWTLVADGPKEKLDKTMVTQPAVLTASVALWRVWCEQSDLRPVVMAGHSLGEYSALVCAGVLKFADAVALVAKRGELMQQAVPEGSGAMAAVLGLNDDVVIAVCAQCSVPGDPADLVEAVNFNSPGQVVIAGSRNAVERACAAAKTAGALRAVMLPVSVPAHSSLMKSAALEFAKVLDDVKFSKAQIPVLHNVGIDNVEDIKSALIQQLYQPVPWTSIVQHIAAQDISQVVECGPGRVLCGLMRRIDRKLVGLSLQDPSVMNNAVNVLGA